MTVDHSKELRIPAWVLTIIVPVLLSVIGYTLGITKINSTMTTKIEHLEKEVVRIDASKASGEIVESVMVSLDRIETKLDKHIENSLE